jgi:polysaccharide export outer membrane protein/exopolysaccharide production protein ExoF
MRDGGSLGRWASRVAASVLLSVAAASVAGAEDYRLGVQDKLRVTVNEWRPTVGEVQDWKAITGEFIIGPAGDVSLPLIGSVPAAGLKPEELATSISQRLKSKVGLSNMPDTAVEVVQFRPFYVVGRVEKPGEFPYRPGLTVLQAVGVAGGLYRATDAAMLRVDKDIISAQSGVDTLALESDQLLMRRARLRVELEGGSSIPIPAELTRPKDDPAVTEMMLHEQKILESRSEALRSQTSALQELKELLDKEIASLGSRLELKDKQIALVRQELATVGSLVSKGLTTGSRQLSLESAEAEVETNKLELDTALLRARQEMSKADRDMIDLRSKRRDEILVDLRETDAKFEESRQKLAASRKLLDESRDFAMQFAAGGLRDQTLRTTYAIVRGSGSQSTEVTVSETDPMQPGDVLKVIVSTPSQKDLSRLSAGDVDDTALVEATPR